MRKRHQADQEDLFGLSEVESLKRKIKELDRQITRALKENDYTTARKLTSQQAELLQAMVEKGDH